MNGTHGTEMRSAGFADIGQLILATALCKGPAVAIDDGARAVTYAEFKARCLKIACGLAGLGLRPGDRIAILAENRIEYLELTVAAARVGVIVCALNWRFTASELAHCIALTQPSVLFMSARHSALVPDMAGLRSIQLGDEFEAWLAPAPAFLSTDVSPGPEDGYIILYTSGTTGASKAALISHRAELARFALSRIDGGLAPTDGFVAWAPLFHMVALEHALHVLAVGGTVYLVDGADVERIVTLAETVPQWWLVLLPGMLDRVVETMAARGRQPAPIRIVGALADLISPDLVAATSRHFNAPYWNTFGSTETGMLPFAGTRFAIGDKPKNLAKAANSMHLFKLVDALDQPAVDEPGEVAVRGPTVFSGYWNAEQTNRHEFRGGWFHLGDVFIARPDGLYDYVDRVKYLIKTGAENVYPAEIERVLMADPRVLEAVVVRRPDPKWGEVPIALVCCTAPLPTREELLALCRAKLASYKMPKDFHFVASLDEFPRSTSGKVLRQILEQRVR